MSEPRDSIDSIIGYLVLCVFIPATPFAFFGLVDAINHNSVAGGLVSLGFFTAGIASITWAITDMIYGNREVKEHQRLVDHFVEQNKKDQQELTERYEKKLKELKTIHENYVKSVHERGKHDK